jgi:predicted nucleic acid-binding protein
MSVPDLILVDTTVLSYAVGVEHPLREPCRRLLRAHGDGRIEATTTIEVIQEFTHVRARRRSRPDAAALARYYMAALSLLVTRAEDLDLALTLFERQTALGAFDSMLAAVALNQRLEALVSVDRAFGEVPGLRWVDPATPSLDHLIGP